MSARWMIIVTLACAFSPRAQAQSPILHLSVQMGHRSTERLTFESRDLDGSTSWVISYIQNGRVLTERVVPQVFFDHQVGEFERALPEKSRATLQSATSSCGEPVTITRGNGREQLCLDEAPQVDRSMFTTWWKYQRKMLGL